MFIDQHLFNVYSTCKIFSYICSTDNQCGIYVNDSTFKLF